MFLIFWALLTVMVSIDSDFSVIRMRRTDSWPKGNIDQNAEVFRIVQDWSWKQFKLQGG
jgi:hypothetical protein